MANETGDMKLLGSFRKFIDRVKNDTNYKPSNPALAVTALEAQHAAGNGYHWVSGLRFVRYFEGLEDGEYITN